MESDFGQNWVSVVSDAVGLRSFPAIGEERTLDGKNWLFYRETVVHRLYRVTPEREQLVGKGARAVQFGAGVAYDLLMIDSAPAICTFGNASKRAPLLPTATCLVDRDDDGAFDDAVARKSGKLEFTAAGVIAPLPYQKEAYFAEMFYSDNDTPLPGVSVMTKGWNEKAMNLNGHWLAPAESVQDLMKSGRIEALLKQATASQLFDIDILFGALGEPMNISGMVFTVQDAKWETLTYRIDRGFGDWYKEGTISSANE
jgi:hypothetical protein